MKQNIINNLETPKRNHESEFCFNHFLACIHSVAITDIFLNHGNKGSGNNNNIDKINNRS